MQLQGRGTWLIRLMMEDWYVSRLDLKEDSYDITRERPYNEGQEGGCNPALVRITVSLYD